MALHLVGAPAPPHTPSSPDPDEARAYLDRLASDAHHLVWTVHHQPSHAPALIHRILATPAPVGIHPAHALALTLAAMADPELRHAAGQPT